MVRTLALTAAVTTLLGFAVGWFAFTKLRATATPTASPGPQAQAPDATGTVAVVQRFALRPADVSADRETPAVAVAPDGTVVLAWASQAEAGAVERTLYLARSNDGGTSFGTPVAWRRVPIYRYTSDGGSKGHKMAFSTHVLPRLAATRDALALGWVEAIDGGPTVRFLVARSRDGGRTFSAPVAAHGGDARRPGFTTLATDPEGGLACGWIDSRNQAQQPFLSTMPAGSDSFAPEQLAFAGPIGGKGICPCCDVAVAVAPDRSAFVAFRNSDSGHRDIWLARTEDGAKAPFNAPIPVSQEPWTFDGCPHDGPSLAVVGDRLHVAWMDAHTGSGRVYHAASPIVDPRFHPRAVNPQGKGTQGHPRLAAGGNGLVHAVWDEGLGPDAPASADASPSAGHPHPAPTPGGRAIMYAVARDGASFSSAHALAPSPGAYQTHPSLAVGPDGTVFAAWNEIDEDGKHAVLVRLANPEPKPKPKPGMGNPWP